jgi:pimeloyl-ACP methyl ester carboxylesterase
MQTDTTAQPVLNTLEKLTWIWQGNKIQYTVMGVGQPLVLIHGFGASIGHWRKNISVLAEKGYRVFALDLLGFGGSDKPKQAYTIELWVEQIRDFWKEHIQEPTVFVGNSIGGLLCLTVIAEYPEIAAGGVLINSAGGLNHRPDELNAPLRFVMGAFTKLVTSPLTGKFIFDSIRQKNRLRKTLYQVYSDRAAVTDELIDMLYEPSCHPGAQQVFAAVLTAPAGSSPRELLPKVKHPLLILWGENDPWTPISGAKIYQDLAQNGSTVEVYPIPNAGHCPHDEKPEIVNELILQWLSRLH